MTLMILFGSVASASCGEVGPLLDLAQHALVAQELEEATTKLIAAEAVLTCGTPATTDEVVQLRLLQGALAIIDGKKERAVDCFGAARRLDPEQWIEGLGPDLRAMWESVSAPDGAGQLHVVPQPVPARIWVDGVPKGPESRIAAGLTLIQIGDIESGTVAIQEVVVESGGMHEVDSSLPMGARPGTELTERARRDWERLVRDAKGNGPREVRERLIAYIGEYEAPAAQAREWLPELDRAWSILRETEDHLRGGFSDASLRHLDEKTPPPLGIVLYLEGDWLAGGRSRDVDQTVTAAPFGGLGLGGEIGLGWRPAPAVLSRLTLGYQSILVDLGSGPDSEVSEPLTRHHGASGWASVGTTIGPVQLLAGPAAFVGQVVTSGQIVADANGTALSVKGLVQAFGGRLVGDLPMLKVGDHALSLGMGGGVMWDGERSYTRGTIGIGVVPGR